MEENQEEIKESVESHDTPYLISDKDIEDFYRADIQKVDVEDRNFIQSIHQYFEQWNTWEPDTALKLILKNGVDKINDSGL